MLRNGENEPISLGNSFDLMKLSQEQGRKIRNVINVQNGSIRVFIHPFFEMYDLSTSSADIVQAIGSLSYKNNLHTEAYRDEFRLHLQNLYTRQYLQTLNRIFKKSPPIIFIGEEDKHIKTTVAICRMLDCLSTILFYQSDTATPFPKEGDFDDIATHLQNLGVTSLLVGGQYMDFEHDMFDDSQKRGVFRMYGYVPYDPVQKIEGIYGCAGNFAFEMAIRNFNITISQASEPYSRPT